MPEPCDYDASRIEACVICDGIYPDDVQPITRAKQTVCSVCRNKTVENILQHFDIVIRPAHGYQCRRGCAHADPDCPIEQPSDSNPETDVAYGDLE